MLGLVVTPDNHFQEKDFEQPLYEGIYKVLDGYMEHVRPHLLPHPFCMLVNDEGLLRDNLNVNIIASLLYGHPIYGTVVFMKDGWNRTGERDVVGLTQDEIKGLLLHFHSLANCLQEMIIEEEET